jgi:hypothetical protein
MASNYFCEKCGGRWLPRIPCEAEPDCPWCEIRRLRAELTAERKSNPTRPEAHPWSVDEFYRDQEAAEQAARDEPGEGKT